jgi:hypothetical protein
VRKFLSPRIPDNLPEAEIIGEADKIADMRWIWEFFRALIIPES